MKKISSQLALIGGLLLLLLFAGLQGCGLGSDIQPRNFEEVYKMNLEKWNALNVSRYRIVVDDTSAFGKNMPWRIEIQNTNILSTINTLGNNVLNNDPRKYTINALFLEINRLYQSKPPILHVTYNQEYGYLEEIYIDPTTEPCCQIYQIKVLEFTIIEG